MTKADELKALADRCEREEASLDLNKAIYVAMGFCLHEKTTRSGAQSDTGHTCDACGADSWGNRSKNGKNQRLFDKPLPYTTSLDAAVSLVPEGWRPVISGADPTLRHWTNEARVFPVNKNDAGWLSGPKEAKGKTMALALCAAALRARAALSPTEGADSGSPKVRTQNQNPEVKG